MVTEVDPQAWVPKVDQAKLKEDAERKGMFINRPRLSIVHRRSRLA
jgi:hypothetical protein